MSDAFDVAIAGGGLHGLSAALHLARAGARVVVLEKSWVGRHASGATAAGVRTLSRDPAEVPIALESAEMWHRLADLVGEDCGFKATGQVRVARTEKDLATLRARADDMRRRGYSHEELVGPAELRELLPALAPGYAGGLTVRRDGSADPHRTLAAFRRACVQAGVEIREGSGVTAIARDGTGWAIAADGRVLAGSFVNAAGAWGAKIAALLGDDIALGVKASMMIVTERLARFVEPTVSAVGKSLSFKQVEQGGLLIGGGIQGHADTQAGTSRPDLARLAAGARAAVELFPCVAGVGIARIWAGYEAKTEDLLPVIGPSPSAANAVHVFGFSGHGFQLVPVAGAIVADLVLRGGTNRPIAAFAPERLMRRKAAA